MSVLREPDGDRVPVLTEVVELDRPGWAPGAGPGSAAPHSAGDAAAVPASRSVPRDAPPPAIPAASDQPPSGVPEAAMPGAAPIDVDALANQVLAALQPRIDDWFEARVHDALVPVLDRVARTLAADARGQLASALRALVADAVARVVAERERR